MAAKITYMGQFSPSFDTASKCFGYLMGIQISSSLIRQITEESGKKVDEKQKELAEQAYAKPEESAPALLPQDRKKGTLYVMTDGSQVNTRKTDKNGSTWKEMKLGEVYSDDYVVKRKDGQSIITKKEYVAHFGGVEAFKPLLFDAAARSGYGTYEKMVMIGDGARWIWNMCDELFPDAIQVLDYYHMCENVYSYAKYRFPSNDADMKKWAVTIIDKIEAGKVDEVLEMLPTHEDDKLPANVPNLHTYLSNNRNRMNYKELKKQGFNIGSGAIESGNKKVIQQRMKQSGMRWGIKTGQTIASLRAKNASGRWKDVEDILCAS